MEKRNTFLSHPFSEQNEAQDGKYEIFFFILPLRCRDGVALRAFLAKLRVKGLSEPYAFLYVHDTRGRLKKDILFDQQLPAYGNPRSPCCSLMSKACY